MDFPISIRDLRKTFKLGFRGREVEAVKGISLQVSRGAAFGFLGPNGAGKTTTIKIITGLIFATGGEVSILGGPPTDPATRRRVGYLPENPSFHDHLTGREVLRFAAELTGVDPKKREKRIDELLELVKIAHAGGLQVRRYSKGMTQRLGIAQALIHEPEIVILDEPMSGLDPVGRRDMKDLIQLLRGQGRTVFFSTHIIADVEELCDEVAIVVGGRGVRAGKVADMLGNEAREVEILASGVPAGLGDHHGPAGAVVTFRRPNESEAQNLIQQLWSSGARVVSVKTRRYGLEDIFMEEVAKQPAHLRLEE